MTKALARRRAALLPSVPAAMQALDRLEVEIPKAATLEEVEAIMDTSAGLQRKFRPVREVANRAGLVWGAALRQIATELEKLPKAKGTRGQGRPKIGGTKKEPPKSGPTLAEIGVSKKLSAQARRFKKISLVEQARAVKLLEADGKQVTPSAIMAALRQKAKEEKKHRLAKAAFSAEGPYDVAVVDWPWKMQKIDRDVRPNQDAFDYPTMTIEEMREFWTKELESRIKPDCHLFTWTTQKFLPDALALVEQFGFKYVLLMVWHKPGGFQPIGLPQYNCEFVVYARKGSPIFIDTKKFDCCFVGERREHSRKPKEFYETIARVTGGSRLDVFARERHLGFAQYGNEVNKFNGGENEED